LDRTQLRDSRSLRIYRAPRAGRSLQRAPGRVRTRNSVRKSRPLESQLRRDTAYRSLDNEAGAHDRGTEPCADRDHCRRTGRACDRCRSRWSGGPARRDRESHTPDRDTLCAQLEQPARSTANHNCTAGGHVRLLDDHAGNYPPRVQPSGPSARMDRLLPLRLRPRARRNRRTWDVESRPSRELGTREAIPAGRPTPRRRFRGSRRPREPPPSRPGTEAHLMTGRRQAVAVEPRRAIANSEIEHANNTRRWLRKPDSDDEVGRLAAILKGMLTRAARQHSPQRP